MHHIIMEVPSSTELEKSRLIDIYDIEWPRRLMTRFTCWELEELKGIDITNIDDYRTTGDAHPLFSSSINVLHER